MPVATNRPDLTRARALLLRLIDAYRIPGYQLTRIEIQKLAYFLQAAGEPMKLQYKEHRYGPYAENLTDVLQRLEGHYIRGYGDRSSRAEIYLLPGALDEAPAALEGLAEAEERLARVSRLIEGFETPYGMELLATIHWVAQEEPRAASDAVIALSGVQTWSQRKRDRFRPEHVEKAWRRLTDEGWLITGIPTESTEADDPARAR